MAARQSFFSISLTDEPIEFEDRYEEADNIDIDMYLNCGRYVRSTSLNADQCCKKGCKNPNEY